jgi:hypothetical protein
VLIAAPVPRRVTTVLRKMPATPLIGRSRRDHSLSRCHSSPLRVAPRVSRSNRAPRRGAAVSNTPGPSDQGAATARELRSERRGAARDGELMPPPGLGRLFVGPIMASPILRKVSQALPTQVSPGESRD